ncbi:MAG: hypothetical protein IJT61_06915, partial [Bacteroidales bacterium]|nr:hypothetical protein [Bacteroidales bacterium]
MDIEELLLYDLEALCLKTIRPRMTRIQRIIFLLTAGQGVIRSIRIIRGRYMIGDLLQHLTVVVCFM